MRYAKWDEVELKIEDSLGYDCKTYAKLKVMILGFDCETSDIYAQYMCYVPAYERIPHGFPTFIIDKHHAAYFDLEDKFIGDTGCFITALNPIYKHTPAPLGERCSHCDDWSDGAEKDQNGTYTCRACRDNPYR